MNVANMEKIKNNATVQKLVECLSDNGVTSITTNSDIFPSRFGTIMLDISMDVNAFEKLVQTKMPWYDMDNGTDGVFVGWDGNPFPDELLIN